MRRKPIEVWVSPVTGGLVTFEWNPCGCHPQDCFMVKGPRWADRQSIPGGSLSPAAHKKRFRDYLKRNGYERLRDL